MTAEFDVPGPALNGPAAGAPLGTTGGGGTCWAGVVAGSTVDGAGDGVGGTGAGDVVVAACCTISGSRRGTSAFSLRKRRRLFSLIP